MKRARIILLLLLPLITVLPSGCIKLWQENLEIATYLLQVEREGPPAVEVPLAEKLWVEPAHVLPPYNARNLILRQNDVAFRASYYTELLMSPADNFRSCFFTWFAESGIFRETAVADRTGMTHSMVVSVLEFYGNEEEGAAVLSVQVTLLDERNRASEVVFSRKYSQKELLEEQSVEALIRAYNRALMRILADCEHDVVAALGAD